MFGIVSSMKITIPDQANSTKGRKTRDIITLFHKPSSAASIRVANLLKQTAATASETATEDQAADHTAQNKLQRTEFDLDITEAPPTRDQLRTIFEYTGGKMIGNFVQGAASQEEAFKKLKESADAFQRPVVR